MIGGLTAILGCIASALAVAGTTEWREATGSQLAAALASAPGGRPKVVHVWASWCRPCAADLPRLLPELRRRAGDFDVVLIALDDPMRVSRNP